MISPWIMETFQLNEFIVEILSLIIVVIPLTYISVVIGELVPKTLALRILNSTSFKGKYIKKS